MKKVFPNIEGTATIHLDVLNAILEEVGGMAILDIMCCEGSQTHKLKAGSITYVDIFERPIKGFEPHKDIFVKSDAIEFLQGVHKKYSAAICADGIEHISKEDGLQLLTLMKEKSNKQIIFTPSGDYLIETEKTNNPDSHKSGWTPDEFEKLGWAVLEFPGYHKTLGIGAFFAFNCKNVEDEFKRISAWTDDIENGLRKPEVLPEHQIIYVPKNKKHEPQD